ncbi:MAG TPA: endonuclease domain-containing protein [Thermoanaerobaculia bacterium]|nr:endonuclease domain-containing protein [Thermoanaerobaculia bacterium]
MLGFEKRMVRSRSEDGTTIREPFCQEEWAGSAVERARIPTAADAGRALALEAAAGPEPRRIEIRRQFPIPPFIADFCCFDLKLIVELDGGIHGTPQQSAHDENRDIYLRSLGYTILRFLNSEVFKAPDDVLQRIAAEAHHLRS